MIYFDVQSKEVSRALQECLNESDIFATKVVYPGGPTGGYYRFTPTVAHTFADLDVLMRALKEWRGRVRLSFNATNSIR